MSRYRTRSVLAVLLGLALTGFTSADDSTLKVKVGQPAPEVELPATQIEKALPGQKDAKALNLKDLQGKKNVVLFFYPKAMTRGCTIESCGFRDLAKKFDPVDTVIVGISIDTLEDQQKFTDKEKLNFPLLADKDQKVTKSFGVLMPERPLAKRVTFVIDKKGVIRKIYTKVADVKKHPQEVLDFVTENLTDNK